MAKAIKIGQEGQEVTAFQESLLVKGFKLPKWGADGDAGHETYNAALMFASDHGIEWEGKYAYKVIPSHVVTAVLVRKGTDSPDEIHDVRYDHPINKGRKTPRDLSTVTGIMLHQTACYPGLGNRGKRWHDIACHMGISPTGRIFWVNDFSAYLFHGHNYNRTTIGIEVDGNFSGVEGKLGTLWKKGGGPSAHTAKQARSVRKTIRFICEEMERRGAKISTIVAHRQGSDDRQSDPGSAIWSNCGVWAQMELGLYNNPMRTKGDGYRIEHDYDPRGMVDWQNRWDRRGIKRAADIMSTLVGFRTGVVTAYGSKWKRLVSAFQRWACIGADGDFGPKTHSTMEAKAGYRWTQKEEETLRGLML